MLRAEIAPGKTHERGQHPDREHGDQESGLLAAARMEHQRERARRSDRQHNPGGCVQAGEENTTGACQGLLPRTGWASAGTVNAINNGRHAA